MSREIKFRGKRLDTGEWVYGSYHHCANGAHHYILALEMFLYREPTAEMCMHPHEVWEVDPETVGQYTDLKDKKGKEVYGGDIIVWDGGEVGRVMHTSEWNGQFDQYRAPFMSAFGCTEGRGFKTFMNVFDPSRYAVVIGNAYDNPELLNPLFSR